MLVLYTGRDPSRCLDLRCLQREASEVEPTHFALQSTTQQQTIYFNYHLPYVTASSVVAKMR